MYHAIVFDEELGCCVSKGLHIPGPDWAKEVLECYGEENFTYTFAAPDEPAENYRSVRECMEDEVQRATAAFLLLKSGDESVIDPTTGEPYDTGYLVAHLQRTAKGYQLPALRS